MKKNIGAQLALYPAPVIVVGAIVNVVDEAWLKEADRMGVISGNKEDKSESGKIDYHTFKPVLFEFPTYEYFVTGEKVGDCAKMN